MKSLSWILLFCCVSFTVAAQTKVPKEDFAKDASEMQAKFKKSIEQAKTNAAITETTKASDCWDEIKTLSDICETYKSIRLKVYYGDNNKLNDLITLVTQLKSYKSYKWGFWCSAAATLIFVDLADFCKKYPLK
ncbi:MAG: hypothetical protein U0Y10_21900 [Spirosomataceae bacterium]